MRLIVHVVAGIHRKEGIAGSHAHVHIVRRLQVIRISAPRLLPALLEHAPHRVIHHLLRAATRPRILPHRLLRQNRRKSAHFSHRPDVSRRRRPQPVAEAHRSDQAQRLRAQPRKPLPQHRSIARRQRAQQQVAPFPPLKTSSVALHHQRFALRSPGQGIECTVSLDLGPGVNG